MFGDEVCLYEDHFNCCVESFNKMAVSFVWLLICQRENILKIAHLFNTRLQNLIIPDCSIIYRHSCFDMLECSLFIKMHKSSITVNGCLRYCSHYEGSHSIWLVMLICWLTTC